MSSTVLGPVDWSLEMSPIGHRNYSIQWLVHTDDVNDGPLSILTASGLPAIGSPWIFGNDNDFWALCWPNFKSTPVTTHEPNDLWIVEQRFSTEPIQRCQDTQIQNPLSEPFRISGSFVKRTKVARRDMNNSPIKSSSHQEFRGGEVEFDDNRPTVKISWNQLTWPGALAAGMVDTVNDNPLWGLPSRTVKLSNVSWTRNLWGICNFYFTVDYEFEIQYDPDDTDPNTGIPLGWDRIVPDKGTRVLSGYSPGYWKVAGPNDVGTINPSTGLSYAAGDLMVPSPANQINPDSIDPTTGNPNWQNPLKFQAYKMAEDGEITEAYLDGKGRPVTDISLAKLLLIQYYPNANLLELGIPVDLNINTFPGF